MKNTHNNVYKKFIRLMLSALTGQATIGVTIIVYCAIALLLLSYVSAQIYAGVLMQEIGELKQVRNELREEMNQLTGDYVSLSSRGRVSRYCEKRLGMVEAAAGENFEILAVAGADDDPAGPTELTKKQPIIPTANRYTFNPIEDRSAQ